MLKLGWQQAWDAGQLVWDQAVVVDHVNPSAACRVLGAEHEHVNVRPVSWAQGTRVGVRWGGGIRARGCRT